MLNLRIVVDGACVADKRRDFVTLDSRGQVWQSDPG
jgi:hypothetical protein